MTKRFFALLMAVVMVLALSVPAFAADTTITAPTNSRVYEIYQIFKADYATDENGKEILSNVVWGTNGTGTTDEAVEDTTLDEIAAITGTDAEKAAALSNYVTLTNPIKTITNGASVTVPTGYYLINDIGEVGKGEDYSLYLVQVAGETVINPKTGTTTSDKATGDRNDSDTPKLTDIEINGESADYDIGDNVPFTLTAKVASEYANYKDTYFLEFNDTLSAGLDFNNDVTVTLDGSTVEKTNNYTVEETSDGFNVTFNNLKVVTATDGKTVAAGSDIVVTYTAKLSGDGVVIGDPGNPNTMHITYSNNPNDNQSSGNTPDDVVVVFTYELDVTKFANEATEGNELKGAGFTLYKFYNEENGTETYNSKTGSWKQVGQPIVNTEGATFEWPGVDDGYYKLSETTTPAGYNTMDDLYFEITASHDETGIINLGTKKLNADGSEAEGTPFTAGKTSEGRFTGELDGDIINNSGSVLPETGGIGTTIFYVVGAVLVVGAAVILFAKKKVEE